MCKCFLWFSLLMHICGGVLERLRDGGRKREREGGREREEERERERKGQRERNKRRERRGKRGTLNIERRCGIILQPYMIVTHI